jgi:hypothetical protein
MRSRSRIKCAHCRRRIRNHEPDLVLRDLDDNGGLDRYYHTSCGAAAYAAAAQRPSAYVLTVRHIEPAVN